MRQLNYTYLHDDFSHCTMRVWGLGTVDNVLNFKSAIMRTFNVVVMKSSYYEYRVCDFFDTQTFFIDPPPLELLFLV